jgi:hypothetical protein
VICITTERRAIVNDSQIDGLCYDWLLKNCGEEIASEYTTYSLAVPMWNSVDLNDALEDLKLELYLCFGPGQSFGATNYYEAKEKLGLPDDRITVPDVFVRAFVRS